VENPLKMQCIDIVQKTIVPIFYQKREQVKKNSPTKKNHNRIPKLNQPHRYKIAYLSCKNITVEKILGLAGQGVGSISKPSKSSGGRKQKKSNPIQKDRKTTRNPQDS
jgi:hypothetical protein